MDSNFSDLDADGGIMARPELGLGTGSLPGDNFTGIDSRAEQLAAKRARAEETRQAMLANNPLMRQAMEKAEKAKREKEEQLASRKEKEGKDKEKDLTLNEQTVKLNGIMAQVAKKRHEDGIAVVGDDNSIRGENYRGVPHFSDTVINGDLDFIASHEAMFGDKDLNAGGIMMEKLAAGLFSKFFPKAMCVGTYKFDDYHNGVDNVLLLGGQPLVAFDEVMSTDRLGDNRQKKQNKVDGRNRAGGADVKYCFKVDGNEVLLGSETNLPMFKVDLGSKMMNDAINNFDLGGMQNDWEKCAFYNIALSIYAQIRDLELMLGHYEIKFGSNPENKVIFKNRLEGFKKLLEDNYPEDEIRENLRVMVARLEGRPVNSRKNAKPAVNKKAPKINQGR